MNNLSVIIFRARSVFFKYERRITLIALAVLVFVALFFFSGCMNPQIQKDVDDAFEQANIAAGEVVKIKTEIQNIRAQVAAGELSVEDSVPKLIGLQDELIAASTAAQEASQHALDAKAAMEADGTPWYLILLYIASGAIPIIGGYTKYAGAIKAVKTLMTAIQGGGDSEAIKAYVKGEEVGLIDRIYKAEFKGKEPAE